MAAALIRGSRIGQDLFIYLLILNKTLFPRTHLPGTFSSVAVHQQTTN